MKTIKQLLMTVAVLLCSVMANAHQFEVDGIYYYISGEEAVVTYKGSSSDLIEYSGSVVIPESVTYNGIIFSVTSIGNYAFSHCSGLTSVTIPNSVTCIGNYAFQSCSGLTSVTMPNSVTSIGEYAFYGCSGLTSITIPNSVTSIGTSAFSSCSGLTSITIPNSVTSIGTSAFSSCSGLTSVTIGNSVTSIGDFTFSLCRSLTSIEIPNSVTSIGYRAFNGCSGLTSITIPNSVTSIGEGVFVGCSSLKNLHIEDGTKALSLGCGLKANYGSSTFVSSPLDTIYIGRDIEYNTGQNYGYSPFYQKTTLKTVILGDNVKNIGSEFFYGCSNLVNIKMGKNLRKIGSSAFYACGKLSSIEIPNSVTSIGGYAFYNCSGLTSVTISSGVTSIGSSAFEGCIGLTEIVIPNTVTSIDNAAFRNCSNLTMVVIPNNIESIGYNAFYDCNNIEEIYSLSRKAISCENLFSNDAYNNAILYVPEGREPAYSKTSPWSNFYIKPIKSFTATYMLNGNEYAKYSVEIFSEIPVPETPFKEGYTFKGWDNKPLYMPKNDVTINGSFEVNTYAVTYIVDGDTVAVDSVAYGAEITPIAAPAKEGYTFSGWSEAPTTMPANDIVISGSFEINTYVVTYLVDGKTFATDSIVFNGDVNVISAPEKEGYTFSGWSYAPKKMPAEDIVISGTFSVNYYSLTYLVDGEEYSSERVAYGTEIKLLDTPVKEGYTFSGWSDAPMTMPAEDIVISGTFSVNYYTLTYLVDGEEYSSESVAYGTEIKLLDAPVKEGYTFSGWSEVPATMPAEDITITGSFVHTSINAISADATVKVNGNIITLVGAENSSISIYTTNGSLVEKIDNYAGEEIMLDKGVYIVRVGGKTVKVKL